MGCDAGLRPVQTGVCYMGVSALPPALHDPSIRGPKEPTCCVWSDGYPLLPEVSQALQHLLGVRSVKKLQFVPSHKVPGWVGGYTRVGAWF